MAPIARTLTAVAVAVLLVATTADAALTTGACLAQKRVAWGDLRKCQATERAKALKGKSADLARCQTKFQAKLTKINDKATKAVIPCRYGDNGDGTVTDYATGLQWERKVGGSCSTGGRCVSDADCGVGTCVGSSPHYVNDRYTWLDALTLVSILNGVSADGSILTAGFAGYADWRLPTVAELPTIVDLTAPGCRSGSPCIDATAFGPTVASNYWSSTTFSNLPFNAWSVVFYDGSASLNTKNVTIRVRAVRGGL